MGIHYWMLLILLSVWKLHYAMLDRKDYMNPSLWGGGWAIDSDFSQPQILSVSEGINPPGKYSCYRKKNGCPGNKQLLSTTSGDAITGQRCGGKKQIWWKKMNSHGSCSHSIQEHVCSVKHIRSPSSLPKHWTEFPSLARPIQNHLVAYETASFPSV